MRFGTVLPLVVMVFLSSAGWSASATAGYWGSSYGWRECWVTMSGLGVCAPAATYRLKASPSRHRRVGMSHKADVVAA